MSINCDFYHCQLLLAPEGALNIIMPVHKIIFHPYIYSTTVLHKSEIDFLDLVLKFV